MPNVALHNIAGENIGEIALSENVFGAEVNQYAVHEVVKAYLANQHQLSHLHQKPKWLHL